MAISVEKWYFKINFLWSARLETLELWVLIERHFHVSFVLHRDMQSYYSFFIGLVLWLHYFLLYQIVSPKWEYVSRTRSRPLTMTSARSDLSLVLPSILITWWQDTWEDKTNDKSLRRSNGFRKEEMRRVLVTTLTTFF